jgi:hypothetical protein
MIEHRIHFTLNGATEPLTGIQTQDNPDAILQAFRNHINSGKPEFINVNALDPRGTYTNTVVVRLSSVASVQVSRGTSPERVRLTVTTSTEPSVNTKKASIKKASPKKKTAKKAVSKKKS